MNLSFNFLVATSKALFLYRNNEFKKLQDSKGVYFGLTCDNTYYIALARNNFDGTGGGNTNSPNSLEFFDQNGDYMNSVSLDKLILDGHQLFYKQGALYIANTGANLVTKLFQDGDFKHIAPFTEYGKDINHINSIAYHKGLYYVVCHRDKEGDDNGSVKVFNTDWSYITSFYIGKHAHNAVICDGFLFSCSSKDGKLVRFELNNPENKVEYDIAPGYLTRGIIISNDIILVGLSEFDTRENRHIGTTGKIRVLKYPEMEFIEDIVIEDKCGQINDLLLV